ncbi:CoA transferase [Bradyrhizobium sp. AUGA SZCCT0240]|uniref:CaiB/BaiF CoA transferase family protein n=1 Tax=Bradyrhizobium sp. AUGA SZCCT0240 TaxID=2807669 RepID=UPI001BA9BBA6|nr:CaiB/BaiF CoA-transferase family protein [Bradyrhizobium sp. AUGA SZCCT0240]MBR1252319.1 CoA transferase [Bradyrhizobium sp. AUGA SZCCT0240]
MTSEAKRGGPCAGLTVLDLSTMVSGPMASQIFSDLGADVIKVEGVGGDTMRAVFPLHKGLGAYFSQYNRNKRSIVVDLKSEEGRQLAKQLALRSDLIIENFRPGVADRLGLAYDDLKKENIGLVYLSIKGFGEDGPYRDQPAYDQVIQGLVGFMAIQGAGGNPEPIRNAVADKVSAMSAAMSALAALWEREKNGGKGQKVVVKMIDAWAAFIAQEQMKNHTFLDSGEAPPPLRQIYRVFDTLDGKVIGLIIQDDQFRGICAALDLPDLLKDSRFAKPSDRLKNVGELNDELGPKIARMTSAAFLDATSKHQVPMAPVNTLEQFFEDPQAKHNRTFPVLDDAEFGRIRTIGFCAEFGETPVRLDARAPKLGEHTDEILRGAGVADDEIRRLREAGVVS